MLPIPLIKAIPLHYQDDERLKDFADRVDIDLKEWRTDVFNIPRYNRPDEAPFFVLKELDFLLEAGFKALDSEVTKRKKIIDAVRSHKFRGLFNDDAKIKIDNVTGFSPGARLFPSQTEDDFILLTDGGSLPASENWSVLGTNGIDPFGPSFVGSGSDPEIPGNVFIDLHEGINTAVLTAAQIQQIVDDLSADTVPAYFQVFLGFTDSGGSFIQYAGGAII